jgi:hypothetical protein
LIGHVFTMVAEGAGKARNIVRNGCEMELGTEEEREEEWQ